MRRTRCRNRVTAHNHFCTTTFLTDNTGKRLQGVTFATMAANCCYTKPASPTHPFSSTSSWRPSFCPSVPRLPKPRLPLVGSTTGAAVFLPQLCPISTAKKAQGLKKHVGQHTTGLFGGKVPEQWLLDRSVHTCPVCSRPISTRTRHVAPVPLGLQQATVPIHRTTPTSDNQTSMTSFPLVVLSAPTSRKPPRKPGPAAVPPPSQEAPPTTTHEPGRTSCPSQKLVLTRKRGCKQNNKCSFNDVRRPCERWPEGARGVPLPETTHCSHT